MCPVAEKLCDLLQGCLVLCQTQHHIKRLALIPSNVIAVEISENQHRQDCCSLVPIDKGVIQDQRMKQRSCLADQIRIGINAKSAGTRASNR